MIRKLIFLLVILFSSYFTFINFHVISLKLYLNSVEKYENGVYLFLTGVNNKISNRVKQNFNYVKKSKYNHIGLLIVKDKELFLLDVQPSKIIKSGFLKKQILRDYISFLKKDLNYIAIWKVKNVSVLSVLNKINFREKIYYDYNFDNSTNSELYCSEFVVKTLNKSMKNQHFISLEKELTFGEKLFINKDIIKYYPVDFFIENNNFFQVSEWIK